MDRVEEIVWVDRGIREQTDGEKTDERLYQDGVLLLAPPPTDGAALTLTGILRRCVVLSSRLWTPRLNVNRDVERSDLQPLHRAPRLIALYFG